MAAKKKSARKTSDASRAKVEKVMDERKAGTLRSGSTGKKVTSKKQAIAIGLSEARREGKKVPPKPNPKKPAKRAAAKRPAARKSTKKSSPSPTAKVKSS